MRIVPHTRPLLFHHGRLYCARFDSIVSTPDFGVTFTDEGRLAPEIPCRTIVRATPLLQRIARAAVYRMQILPDGSRVFVFRGGIYRQRSGETIGRRTFVVTRGSRPVSLAAGGDGLVVFGEYWPNRQKEPVHIYGSRDGGAHWDVMHTFGPGEIQHVHGISYDRYGDEFWICTGDNDDECQILRASRDFSKVQLVRKGGQSNRYYSILVTEHALLSATDTPLEDNYICAMDKCTGEVRRLQRIENSSFHGCFVGDRFFVATIAEPSAVNDVRAIHLWTGRLADRRCCRVLTLPVDLPSRIQLWPGIPNNLFQWAQLFFPEGENPAEMLVGHVMGIAGMDDAMVCWSTASLDDAS